jgi:hypothetical protein
VQSHDRHVCCDDDVWCDDWGFCVHRDNQGFHDGIQWFQRNRRSHGSNIVRRRCGYCLLRPSCVPIWVVLDWTTSNVQSLPCWAVSGQRRCKCLLAVSCGGVLPRRLCILQGQWDVSSRNVFFCWKWFEFVVQSLSGKSLLFGAILPQICNILLVRLICGVLPISNQYRSTLCIVESSLAFVFPRELCQSWKCNTTARLNRIFSNSGC